MNRSQAISRAMVLALTCGCSSGTVNIGEKPDAALKTGVDALAGNWDGYIEAYKFIDDSDTVRLTLSSNGTSTLRFGTSASLTPPTNPNDLYPRNFPLGASLPPTAKLPGVWTGFDYSLHDVQIQAADTTRVIAGVVSTELFAPWCGLQTSYLVDAHSDANANVYACAPCDFPMLPTTETNQKGETTYTCMTYASCASEGALTGAPDFPTMTIGCEQEVLCANGQYNQGLRMGTSFAAICACDANGCNLAPRTPDVSLDLTLTDGQTTLTGALVFGDTNRTLLLKRQ